MCGRYHKVLTEADLQPVFELVRALEPGDPAYRPRYNVAPTDRVPIVRLAQDGARVALPARWGLLPFFAKDLRDGARMINARVETVATLPAFRDAFKERRCLVPATGYYEWVKHPDKTKTPFSVAKSGWTPLAFAGLWSRWHPKEGGEAVETFTIITTDPLGVAGDVHDRMPIILPPDRWAAWLEVGGQDLLVPDVEGLEVAQVEQRVGNVKNDDPELLVPVAPEPELPLL